MGLFGKLFGKRKTSTQKKEIQFTWLKKGDALISVGDNFLHREIRKLTEEQKEKIGKSTIQLMSTQLYMHYWADNLVCENPNDQEWQNKVLFFWKAEEPFPKKSLPPIFKTFKTRYFIFTDNTSSISLHSGQVIPWFGMPGLGEKYFCMNNSQKVTVPELNKLGIIEYLEIIELTASNLDILANRDQYFFLIDNRITPFINGNFYLNGVSVPIDIAYSVGGIHIVKKIEE